MVVVLLTLTPLAACNDAGTQLVTGLAIALCSVTSTGAGVSRPNYSTVDNPWLGCDLGGA